ncbi:MAG: Flp family type IVb pilin [Desulfobaccales bacterium]
MNRVNRLIREEEAASSVEYGILMAGIALVIALSINTLGQAVSNIFTQASGLFR